jgi:hypothetical protein
MTRLEKTFATQRVRLERRLPSYWRVTFDHSPLNIFGPESIPQLNEIITALETDEHVKVVVFDSAVEGFFLTHYDFLAPLEDSTSIPTGPTGLQALPTCWYGSAARRSCRSLQSAGERRGSAANSRWRATCVSRAAKRPSCPSGKSAPASCPVADRWPGCLASWGVDARWRSCSALMIFAANSPTATGFETF